MMPEVARRNIRLKVQKAVVLFYSRIVLKKINHEAVDTFRKLEKACKSHIKLEADIKFLK